MAAASHPDFWYPYRVGPSSVSSPYSSPASGGHGNTADSSVNGSTGHPAYTLTVDMNTYRPTTGSNTRATSNTFRGTYPDVSTTASTSRCCSSARGWGDSSGHAGALWSQERPDQTTRGYRSSDPIRGPQLAQSQSYQQMLFRLASVSAFGHPTRRVTLFHQSSMAGLCNQGVSPSLVPLPVSKRQ
jgi:hypothetical protein